MSDFFLFETEVPAGSGFELFGFGHLAWLFGISIFVLLTGLQYMRQSEDVQIRVNRIMGIVFPVIAIYRDTVLFLTGHFDRGFLPFHLCSMALWIATIYIWTNNRFFGTVYVLLCVPGALGALIFPDWVAYPFVNYMCIHGFISHGLLVGFGVWLVMSGRLCPAWKDFWMPVIFGLIGFPVITLINNWLGTNYWFLSHPSQGSPMVWIIGITGNRWYFLGYFIFCCIVVAVWQSIISGVGFLVGMGRRIKLGNVNKGLF